MGRLDGKVAIVTGAASGIGAATAERVAAEGARTVVADLDAEGARTVAAKITAAGGSAVAVAVDLGDVAEYGGLDVLRNNAAATRVAATQDLPIAEADPDVWDLTMRVNLRGTMVATQAAVPHLIARGGGSIINTASGSGLLGDLRNPAYGASKAGLVNFTKYVATEFGKQGVRCNAISPGFIVTAAKAQPDREAVLELMLRHHLTPRLGRPEDVAALVVFLASDESGVYHRREHLRGRRDVRAPAVRGGHPPLASQEEICPRGRARGAWWLSPEPGTGLAGRMRWPSPRRARRWS